MSPLTEVRRVAGCHPFLWDGLLAATVYALALWVPPEPHDVGPGPSTWQVVVFGALAAGPLTVRRRWPTAALACTLAGMACYLVLGGRQGPLMLAPMVAVYTVALKSSRRTTVAAAVVAELALVLGKLVAFVRDVRAHELVMFDPRLVSIVAEIALAAAVGDAVRNRRAYVAAVEERARRAERTREEEAERRVIEERLRIARELHDVLAHHVALINVQAEVAVYVMDTDPGQAREALSHVRRAGQAVLEELGATVSLLRRPNAQLESAPEPAPGLDRLPGLLEAFAAGGLTVDQRVVGERRELPATVDLAAYRIVQEALTNVHKHGGGAPATLRIAYAPGELRVEITDSGPGGSPPGEGTGHGLLGMRERAHSVGGTFEAGPRPEGGFRVRAVLLSADHSPGPVPLVARACGMGFS
ncbi:histidine kinase [Actinoallomurus purpureus]|uniref:sensor histidine kinase n=1 Tax=Actinoallomurus purpureus TaxID=478114 RepID=UPI00209365BE|nr:histidine kinase [Actinoallomurus purpureus]MCO6003646.1 histidine kinase [Actinoallomurus purpureus]